jgi:hypothetical protein
MHALSHHFPNPANRSPGGWRPLWWIGLLSFAINVGAADPARPNVLFSAMDDLRNDFPALGVEHAQTPHLDCRVPTTISP